MEPVTLHTARLELSIPTHADVDAMTEAAQDPEVPRWTTLPSPYARSDAEEFIALTERRWANGTVQTWAIRLDGAWIGGIGLHGTTPGGTAEIGYWMAKDARGHGYLSEAAARVVDFGFAPPLGLVRIEWRAIAGNVASARAARSVGFRYEGTARQGLSDIRGRHDGWVAGLLATDDREPVPWPILG